jgi:hypothetical protein
MRNLILLLSLLFMAGCVQSLQPFYTEEQLTFDKNLVGYWTDAEGKNTIDVPDLDADPEAKTYRVAYTDEQGKTGHFVARLAQVGKYLLADLTPEELPDSTSGTYRAHFVPIHSFLLIEVSALRLKIRSMDYEWLKKELDAHPAALAHERIGGDRILFTAPSEKVQAFVLKHVDTQGAYGEWTEFKRSTPKPTTQPTK